MKYEEFKKELKLEGTVLDRRRKLTLEQVEYIKNEVEKSAAKDRSKVISKLAEEFEVTPSAIKWHTDPFVKLLNNFSHKERYAVLGNKEKRTNYEKATKSAEEYKRRLYETMMEAK